MVRQGERRSPAISCSTASRSVGRAKSFWLGPKKELRRRRAWPSSASCPTSLFDAGTRRTFGVEAKLHAAAKHRNVVEIFESGEYEGEP